MSRIIAQLITWANPPCPVCNIAAARYLGRIGGPGPLSDHWECAVHGEFTTRPQ